MSTTRAIVVALAATMALSLSAQTTDTLSPEDRGYNTINRTTAEAHIGFLAADELEGREAGYKSGRIAGNYVESQLKALGLEPWDGTIYSQPFDAYHVERQKRGRYTVHPDSIAKIS
ncbi:MAG: aminopeptidase, partial [Muribaculaceae bacterium]|nr:aminopeptidase [Muribaculaceae bacterium]